MFGIRKPSLHRNAARARVKDATGKAQRDHFGKKRFEILRTCLSKGQCSAGPVDRTRNSLKALSKISLAHARRAQAAHVGKNWWYDDEHEMKAVPVNGYAPSVRSSARRTPRSGSSCSRILRALDADNPTTQRAKVEEILRMPDLLGLSANQGRARSRSSCRSVSNSSPYQSRCHWEAKCHEVGIIPDAVLSSSTAHLLPSLASGRRYHPAREHRLPPPSPPSGVRDCPGFRDLRSASPFVPMQFDSSPPETSHRGRAGYCSDAYHWLRKSEVKLYEGYEPTRVSVYPDWFAGTSSAQSGTWPRSPRRRSDSFESLCLGSPELPTHNFLVHSSDSEVSHLRLLPARPQCQVLQPESGYLSPSRTYASSAFSPDSFRPSRTASTSVLDDIPQASFSPSPPALVASSHPLVDHLTLAGSARYISAGGSVTDASPGNAPAQVPMAKALSELDSSDWQPIDLAGLLHGALFEDADPWQALDEVLHLDSRSGRACSDMEPDFLFIAGTHTKRGVGFITPAASPLSSQRSIETDVIEEDNFSSSEAEYYSDMPTVDDLQQDSTSCTDTDDEAAGLAQDLLYDNTVLVPAADGRSDHVASRLAGLSEDRLPTRASPPAMHQQAPLCIRVEEQPDDQQAWELMSNNSAPTVHSWASRVRLF
ncbi:hypothetical protein BD414DRAFT_4396 [Trametes punicea]|nr:hypothetical protein BD414DRAFT_4396 [Trametes punicea]